MSISDCTINGKDSEKDLTLDEEFPEYYDFGSAKPGLPAPKTLAAKHRDELTRSGLSLKTIEASGIYSVSESEAHEILGFSPRSGGFAIPYPNTEPPFTRIKPDIPFESYGKPAKYLSPKKENYAEGNRLYIPPTIHPLVARDPGIALIVTEGEKKALAAVQNGFPCVALPGVTCHVNANNAGPSEPIADLDLINWKRRRVFIVFDSDSDTNEAVAAEGRKLAVELSARGAIVLCPLLPKPYGDENERLSLGNKFGLDDFLLARGATALAALLGSARTKAPARPDPTKGKPVPINLVGDWVMRHLELRVSEGCLWVYRDGAFRDDGAKAVEALAQECLEADQSWLPEKSKGVVAFIMTKLSRLGLEATPDLSTSHVNVQNGRINISNGELEPHTSSVFSFAQIPVSYDPSAKCQRTEAFLSEVLEEQDKISLAEELSGYFLIPTTRFQLAFILTGSGANGKSTFLDQLIAMLGRTNVSNVALHDLIENRFRLAKVHGKLANIAADLDSRSLNSTGLFKELVGGDIVTAEEKFRPPFAFKPTARLLFSCNALPFSPDHSKGFMRRLVILPFEKSFGPGEADRDLIKKLTTPEELSGLLNLALQGLRRLLERGAFTEPTASVAASDDYSRNINSVLRFVRDVCRVEPGNETLSIPKPVLYQAYRNWCEAAGFERICNDMIFARELRLAAPGIADYRPGQGKSKERIREWRGIDIIAEEKIMLT